MTSHEPMIKSEPIDLDEEPFETASIEPAAPVAAPTRRGLLVMLVVALLLAVALVALVVINQRHDAEADASAAASEVVTAHVTQLLSYTPATVVSDLDTEKEWLTGGFLDEYTALVTDTVAAAAVNDKVTVKASIVAHGVQAASTVRVEMLLFINVSTTRAGSAKPETQGSRVRVVAEKVDGDWLISTLAPV